MPSALVPDPAPLVERGQNVIDGDVEMLAGTRFARIKGITASLLAAMPPDTFLANLYNTTQPARPFDAVGIAGTGISYAASAVGANFAEPAQRVAETWGTAATSQTYTYPGGMIVGQVLIIVIATGGLTTITTPAAWTLIGSQATSTSRLSAFKRVVDGTEPGTQAVTFGTASGALVRSWVLDRADGAVEFTAAVDDSAASTTLDIGSVTPSWATLGTNNFYLALIGLELESGSTISAFPASYVSTGQDALASGTATINCRLGFCERSVAGTSEDPGAFTYGASRSAGLILAIRGRDAGQLNWDGVNVRKNSTGSVFTRRRLNLIEGTGISLTVADDAGNDEVDVTVTALPGGGAGWDDVLLVDAHSGASNPIVDDAQYLQFGIAAPPVSGQIRTNELFELRGDKSVQIRAGEEIHLLCVDSSDFISTGGAIDVNANLGLHLISGGSTTIDSGNNMTLTSVNDMTFTPSGNLNIGSGTLTNQMTVAVAGIIDVSSATDVINLSANSDVNLNSVNAGINLTADTASFVSILPRGVSGDPGTEASGITIHGITYQSSHKVSDIGGTNQAQFILHRHATALEPLIVTSRSLSDTAAHAAVVDGNGLGTWFGCGWDGTEYIFGAGIGMFVDGTPGTSDMPGRLSFFTTADGAFAPLERIRIGPAGQFGTHSGSLNYGTSGQVFTSAGPSAPPAWTDPNTLIIKGWDDVLAVDANSGANNPIVSVGQFVQFGAVGPTGSNPQIRSGDATFRIRGGGVVSVGAVTGAGMFSSTGPVEVAADAGDLVLQGFSSVQVTTAGSARLVISGTGEWTTPSGTSGQFLKHLGAAPPDWASLTLSDLPSITGPTILGRLTGTGVPQTLTGEEAQQIDRHPLFSAGTLASGTYNNHDPGVGFTWCGTLLLSAGVGTVVTITGFDATAAPAPLDGTEFTVINIGQGIVEYVFNSGGSSAGNQLITGADLETLRRSRWASATWRYYSGFWRLVAVNEAPVRVLTALNATVNSARRLNFNASANATFSHSYDATNDEIDVTCTFVNIAGKSVLANATGSSGLPAALTATTAFQHLRVNSGNNGLEWSVLTGGDFPAATVPVASIATIAANTMLANATAGSASPTAVAVSDNSFLGRSGGNISNISSAVQTALIRASGNMFWGGAAADQVLRRSGSGDLGFGTLVTNNIGTNQVALDRLAQIATPCLLGRTTAATGNVEALTLTNSTSISWNTGTGGTISVERAALTGDVTAGANSNATTIANDAVTDAKLANMVANSIKANPTGSTADPQNLIINADSFPARISGTLGSYLFSFLAGDGLDYAAGAIDAIADIDHDMLIDASLGAQFRRNMARAMLWEDFTFANTLTLVAGTAQTLTADTNWGALATGANGSIAALDQGVTGAAGSPGEIALTTGATDNCRVDLYRGASLTTRFIRASLVRSVKIRALITSTASCAFGLGLADTSFTGNDGAYFYFDTDSDTTIHVFSADSGGATSNDTDTAVAPGTSYRTYEIRRGTDVTTWEFYLDGSLVATHATGSKTRGLNVILTIFTRTTAAKAMILDYVNVDSIPITRD